MNSSGLECQPCLVHLNRHDLEVEEFPYSFPSLSLKVDRMERERMTSSGLQCEVCVVHF